MTEQLTLMGSTNPSPARPGPIGLPIASVDPDKLTAATYLGVSRATIYRLLEAGELEGFHVGAAAMVTRASLDAFVARQREAEPERRR